ncbi:hypothetical protein [Ponticaulis sp.]|jgi:uncharacterized membrane protein|nr:hypothetical protein [Ponticaulis sp.]|tara:strand:- start:315 stop:440 length:126 start_codon:yes stop_codon:yes gene_type:complete
MQTMFAFLLISGLILGLVIAMLGHPKIYRAIFGGSARSLDH